MGIADKYLRFLNEAEEKAEGLEGLPKGWTHESVEKFVDTLSKTMKVKPMSKDWFYKCEEKMKKQFGEDRARRFCAAIADEYTGSTYWRGKGKSQMRIKADVKAHQNVKQEK